MLLLYTRSTIALFKNDWTILPLDFHKLLSLFLTSAKVHQSLSVTMFIPQGNNKHLQIKVQAITSF